MTTKESFDFITDPTVKESNMDDYLERMMDVTSNRTNLDELEKVEDEVFKHSYIPYTMNDVVDYERDLRRVKQGENLIYTTLHGLKEDLSTPRLVPEILKDENGKQSADKIEKKEERINEEREEKDQSDEEESGSGSEDDDDDSEEESDSQTGDEEDDSQDENNNNEEKLAKLKLYSRPRDESPNSRKARKNAIKEEKREKRKNKTPKHVKKRAIKVSNMKRNAK